MIRRVRLCAALVVLLSAAACGTLTPQAAPAPAAAAHPLPVDPPSPLMQRHFGLDAARARASTPSAKPPARSAGSGARLFRCDEAPGGRCGRVKVPLDRAHPSRGKVPIFFEYYRHRDPGPTNEAILATLGGPGASVTQEPFFSDFVHDFVFAPLLDTRDLILLDQRGVGRSDAIDCKKLQNGTPDTGDIEADVTACGEQLGSAAGLYGSGDVALDIEAVRRALGIEKLDFYGGSYSGVDIQAYAVRFPGHLRSAVLDSPLVLPGFDAFGATTVQAMKRAVGHICKRSRSCAAERAGVAPALRWLAGRLRDEPVEGVGYDAAGEPHDLSVTEGFLLWRVLQSEEGGFVSLSEIAAAADALRAGDEVPLLRLAAEDDGPLFGDEGRLKEFSAGHNWARGCTDLPMPWDKSASIPTRRQQWATARDGLPEDRFAPFSIDGWLAPFPVGPIGPEPCVVWPAPEGEVPPPIPPGAEFPGSVPAFVLSGDLDFGTPTADARRLAEAWPNSRFVEIENASHHTAVSARFECSAAMVVRFIKKLKPGDTSCARNPGLASIPAVGRFPLTAEDARPAAVDPRGEDHSIVLDRKVATVATAAVTDAFRRTFLQSELSRGVGLRGGSFRPRFGIPVVKLKNARFAEDVAVSGNADYPFDTESIDATVTVDGPGTEDGTLHVTGVWFGFLDPTTVLRIQGSLGGRRVALRVPAS